MKQMYDSHLDRISQRPGENLQLWLVRKILSKSRSLSRIRNSSEVINVLEIGPGSGRAIEYLLNFNVMYDVIEPTNLMRDNLISRYAENPKFGESYSDPLPFVLPKQEGKYDFVLAMHVLEHTRNQYDAREFVASCFSMLNKNGELLIVTPDAPDYGKLFFNIDWSHGYYTSVERVRALLDDVGFQRILSVPTRAGLRNPFVRIALYGMSRIFPVKFLDFVFDRILGTKNLASGFSVGFLRKNVIATGIKLE